VCRRVGFVGRVLIPGGVDAIAILVGMYVETRDELDFFGNFWYWRHALVVYRPNSFGKRIC
jgi:hypothetical protein